MHRRLVGDRRRRGGPARGQASEPGDAEIGLAALVDHLAQAGAPGAVALDDFGVAERRLHVGGLAGEQVAAVHLRIEQVERLLELLLGQNLRRRTAGRARDIGVGARVVDRLGRQLGVILDRLRGELEVDVAARDPFQPRSP
ncbi:MAG: hypothetical protein B7Z40_10990 [Bosea sp. 12-68-7]|nr:MAG: hypothetical protein B7Z40_10990 [Bosea sp. 12-68-7]